MATFTKLPSGKWRVQVRRGDLYKSQTFTLKRDAQTWASQVEIQAEHIIASGFQPVPEKYSLADLIIQYSEECDMGGKTKQATHKMLQRELGSIGLKNLNSIHLRDFIDRRLQSGAGGVTISADLSFLGAILKWGRHARRMDIPTHLTLDARRDLNARKVGTRSAEREREPTPQELASLFAYWDANTRQRIPMRQICMFALATTMRQEEICTILAEDVSAEARTVVIRDRKDPRRKDGNNQTVPLLPDAWSIVEPMVAASKTGRLFPYQASSVSTAFTRACVKLGINDLHFHDLRHKATSDLFRAGLTIPQVAVLTGHRTWTQLKRYTHTKAEDVHAAMLAIAQSQTGAK